MTEEEVTKLYYRAPKPAGLVLLYHRVADLDIDPQRLAVSPRNFAEQLRILREWGHPMSLGELVARVEGRDLPARAVAITFDDGYADNLHVARPLLKQAGVPATFFLTSTYLTNGREFWWDDLERLLLRPGTLPSVLTVPVGHQSVRWTLDSAACYDADVAAAHRDWNVEREDTPTPRHAIYRALCRTMKTLATGERQATLSSLETAAGQSSAVRRSHAPLEAKEVKQLVDDGEFTAGAHSTTHPALAALPPREQQSEIASCKSSLEAITGRNVDYFAYPFGGRGDYTATTARLVRDARYTHAFSAQSGAVTPKSDRWQIPRLLMRDWEGADFLTRLRQCL